MTRLEIIVPRQTHRWQTMIVERLRNDGHEIGVTVIDVPAGLGFAAAPILAIEAALFLRGCDRLSARDFVAPGPVASPALRLDLTGKAPRSGLPTLSLTPPQPAVLARLVAGKLPDLTILLDGMPVGTASPMVDDRVLVVRAFEDVLARVVTLTVATVRRWPQLDAVATPASVQQQSAFLPAFLFQAAPRALAEFFRRLRYRFAHWRVGYRFNDGPGVAATGTLGAGWSVLPDDGTHFYADPFPFEQDGRHYIFVEDYVHSEKKAVISVAAIDERGVASAPRPVLVEPYHLSYPQVFRHDGEIWMLPESSRGKVTLYRAVQFPDRWEEAAILIDGEISDATLLQHDGHLWLFATDRDGAGSTSDTLVVFRAPALLGPWTPHPRNPILIDRRRARPGGAFVEDGGRLVLPIQDGTLGYGGGLGLSEITRLDWDEVQLTDPRPISPAGDFPYPRMHTLNRAGRLEVIDGIAAVRRR